MKKMKKENVMFISFSSPSGMNYAFSDAIDLKFYLPFDFPWTIQKVLSTENTYYTGVRNVPTGADTLNVPIGVYIVNHTFQLNITINIHSI